MGNCHYYCPIHLYWRRKRLQRRFLDYYFLGSILGNSVLKQKEAAKKITRYDLTILLGMGLISTVGIGITEALALRYSQAINYSFLIRTVILFTFLFAYIFLGEKLTLKKIVLAIVILFGSYLLIAQGQKLVFSAGDIFTLIEAALIALGNTVLGENGG